MNAQQIFGSNVRKERLKQKMTLKELSSVSGYNRRDLSKLENGEINFSLSTAIRLAKSLNKDLPSLFELNDANPSLFIEDDYLSVFVQNITNEIIRNNKYQYAIYPICGIAPENFSRTLNQKATPTIKTIDKICSFINSDVASELRRK